MNLENKKIVFFGTPFFAKEILRNLTEKGAGISLVVTQPSKPVGRKQKIKDSEVKKYSTKNELKIVESSKPTNELVSRIKEIDPDLIITAAFGSILTKEILEIPQLGSINIHPSLLPKYRGPSPIQYALLNGETKTGTTIMLMDDKMDAGEILSQKEVFVEDEDTYPELEKRLIKASNSLLPETIEDFLAEKITPKKQDDNKATFTKIIEKNDGLIDWKNTASKIFNKYRAFYLWPKIYTYFNDNNIEKKIVLHEIEKNNSTESKLGPGEVGKQEEAIVVGTKNGLLKIKTIQMEGKMPMPIKQFTVGKRNFIGSILGHN